jgi:hypothetical protein
MIQGGNFSLATQQADKNFDCEVFVMYAYSRVKDHSPFF